MRVNKRIWLGSLASLVVVTVASGPATAQHRRSPTSSLCSLITEPPDIQLGRLLCQRSGR
jgi:hypothetical protein